MRCADRIEARLREIVAPPRRARAVFVGKNPQTSPPSADDVLDPTDLEDVEPVQVVDIGSEGG